MAEDIPCFVCGRADDPATMALSLLCEGPLCFRRGEPRAGARGICPACAEHEAVVYRDKASDARVRYTYRRSSRGERLPPRASDPPWFCPRCRFGAAAPPRARGPRSGKRPRAPRPSELLARSQRSAPEPALEPWEACDERTSAAQLRSALAALEERRAREAAAEARLRGLLRSAERHERAELAAAAREEKEAAEAEAEAKAARAETLAAQLAALEAAEEAAGAAAGT